MSSGVVGGCLWTLYKLYELLAHARSVDIQKKKTKNHFSPDNDAARRSTGHKDVFNVLLTDNVTNVV